MISTQLGLAQAFTAAFTDEACTGLSELGVRTFGTGVLLIFGLWTMNWRYWTKHHISHGVINVLVILAWLLALEPKPFSCWLNGGDKISSELVLILTTVQIAVLVIVTGAAAYVEKELDSRKF